MSTAYMKTSSECTFFVGAHQNLKAGKALHTECAVYTRRTRLHLDRILVYNFTASLGSFNFMFHFGYFQPRKLSQSNLWERCRRDREFPPQRARWPNQSPAPFTCGKHKPPPSFQNDLYAHGEIYLLSTLRFFGDTVALLPQLGKKHRRLLSGGNQMN